MFDLFCLSLPLIRLDEVGVFDEFFGSHGISVGEMGQCFVLRALIQLHVGMGFEGSIVVSFHGFLLHVA